jgi:hypothetical protein
MSQHPSLATPMRIVSLFAALAAVGIPAVAAAETRNVDILFVIDDSESMEEEQAALAESFDELVDGLAAIDGGLPDLHIGVVSSNMGGGVSPGCAGDGDDGALQNFPRIEGCIPPGGAFISDIAGPGSTRERNYDQTQGLAGTLACISQLGTFGCGFEQHLASLKKALDGTVVDNDGFLRDDAVLVVIVLADEDDCSISNPLIVDDVTEEAFGPYRSFRCTQWGLTCDPAVDQTPGPRDDCTPRADSEFIVDPQEIVDFLVGLKGANNVVFGLVAGNSTPVVVGISPDGVAELESSCQGGLDPIFEAAPAVRLAWTAQQLPRGVFSSICNGDQTDLFEAVIAQAAAAMDGFDETPDAGPSGSADASPDGDAGGTAADPDGESGCGCAASDDGGGAARAAAGALLVMLVSCLALRRRRRA